MKSLFNIFRKDCRQARWPLAAWYLYLFLWGGNRVLSNGLTVEFVTGPGTSRAHLLEAGLYPFCGLVALYHVVPLFASEPLLSPKSYWRTRPMQPGTILRAKWLFVGWHLMALPMMIAFACFFIMGFPAGLAAQAAFLKIGLLAAFVCFISAVAYLAPEWGRFAGILLATGIVLFLVRALLDSVSENPPLVSNLGSLIGVGIASFAAMVTHRARGKTALSGVVLFGLLAILAGGSVTAGALAVKRRKDPSHKELSPLDWMKETRVRISEIGIEKKSFSPGKPSVPAGLSLSLEVEVPKEMPMGYIALRFGEGELDGVRINPPYNPVAGDKYPSLSRLFGKPVRLAEQYWEDKTFTNWTTSFSAHSEIPVVGRYTATAVARFHRWQVLGTMPVDGELHTFDLGHTKFELRDYRGLEGEGGYQLEFEAYHHLLRPRDRVEANEPLPSYRGDTEYTFIFTHPDDEFCYRMSGDFRGTVAVTPPDYGEVEHVLTVNFSPAAPEHFLGGTLHILKEEKLGEITIPLSAEVPIGGK